MTVTTYHYKLSDIPHNVYLALIIFFLNTILGHINYFHLFNKSLGSMIGFIIDIVAMTLFIYYAGGSDAQQFYLVFLIIVLATATIHSIISAFVTTLIGVIIYGLIITSSSPNPTEILFSGQFLSRISFLFVVATFIGYLSEEVERHRREKMITEEALTTEVKNLTQYLKDVFQSVPSGIIVVDTDEKITVFNKRAEEILGIPVQNVLGRQISDIYPLKGFAKILDNFYDQPSAFREDTSPQARVEVHLDRGIDIAPLCIGLRFSTMYNVSGKRIGAIGVFQDLTQIKQYEEELLKKERMAAVGQLASGMAHDFFNTLGGLKGIIELAIANPEKTPISETLSITKHSLDSSLAIVRNLLSFSHKPQPQIAPVLLHNVVNESLTLIKHDLDRDSIEIIKRIASVPPIMSDPDLLQQVFLNLLINARQSILPNRGTITIEVKNGLDFIEIIISDNGRGIRLEDQTQIFNPFFTTKTASPKKEGGGLGLGLYVSKEIIKSLQGTIEVQTKPEQGASFVIRLPLSLT
ncbi:MAG: ATP-binding protein [Planctomycetota bacterium]